MTKYSDTAASTVASLIAAIEDGPEGWSAPWHHNGSNVFTPTNAVTNNRYTAGNWVCLVLAASDRGWGGHWATYKQWSTIGGQVRKGEHGTALVRWVEAKKKDRQEAEAESGEIQARRMVPVTFTVFNRDQVDGAAGAETLGNVIEPIEAAEALIAWTGATISYGGDRAYYRRSSDAIQLPHREAFTSTHGMYSTVLHELTHWTAAESRCDREVGLNGSDEYATEELIAELGSAMLCAQLGLANQARQDHAAYLSSWLKALKADPTHLFTVASKAQQAVNYINSLRPVVDDAAWLSELVSG